MNKLQSYFIASVLYVMTPHAFAQGTVTIYLPGEQQPLSVGPVENVVQLVTQPQLRDRLWWPGVLLTDSAAKAKALKDYQHVMAQLASWEAEADDDGVCLTVNIWWPASKRGHLISPSGWRGATPVMRAILPTRFAG
ncbi:hypothetical protein AWP54_18460 [Escherichia coli]|nr:hypothetical protein AWP54_18460 [Escherichia coli]